MLAGAEDYVPARRSQFKKNWVAWKKEVRIDTIATFLNIVNIMVGAGIVVLPHMMLVTGIGLGLFVFVLDAVLATISIFIIHTVSV